MEKTEVPGVIKAIHFHAPLIFLGPFLSSPALKAVKKQDTVPSRKKGGPADHQVGQDEGLVAVPHLPVHGQGGRQAGQGQTCPQHNT